jgi:serine-type D-Ala-D-Ala carboxypeptidase/endopeptidase
VRDRQLGSARDGIPCTTVVASASEISFEVPVVRGTLKGSPSADGNTLSTMWSQGGAALALVLTRQTAAIQAPAIQAPAIDPAMPPVEIAQLKSVIDADLGSGATQGDLAPASGGGVTIGVVSHGKRLVWTYGAAKVDSVFEIGSISNTFTGLILSQMPAQNTVKLDEPVRALLPSGTVAPPASGGEITLLDLSAAIGPAALARQHEARRPDQPVCRLRREGALRVHRRSRRRAAGEARVRLQQPGRRLLGQALAERSHTTYEALLKKQVTGPLGMNDTVIAIPPALEARFLPGHDGERKPARAWDFAALAGAGAIRSTAGDMLTYLEAQLHPIGCRRRRGSARKGRRSPRPSLRRTKSMARPPPGSTSRPTGFATTRPGWFWHDGATGGYSAFAIFAPEKDFAVVVLSNTSLSANFTDTLGRHIGQRLHGLPAVSLKPAAQ